jgi:hypothetical protein
MADRNSEPLERAQLLAKAVSRWDNEGGAGEGGRVHPAVSDAAATDALPLTNAELVHLQVRVIALENLLKVLIVDAPEHQVALMRGVAALISPRIGFTQHPLTVQATACMINLVESAAHLRELRLDPENVNKP